jgi:hypothetical protein
VDRKASSRSRELDFIAADARGPFRLGPRRGILAGRKAGRVRIPRQDGQALGLDHGGTAADARGPFRLGPRRGILAGRKTGRVRIRRQDGQALGLDHGGTTADAHG